MAEQTRPCAPVVVAIGAGGGWYRICKCPAHPSFDKAVQGYRAARIAATQHEAKKLPPEPPTPTVREAIQQWVEKP